MPKVIRNVNMLDMSNATIERIEGIKAIENVNLFVYHERLAPTLAKTSQRNVNLSIAVPSGVTFVNGSYELSKSVLSGRLEPLSVCVNGRTIVQPDVSEDLLRDGLALLFVNGRIYCPIRLVGEISNKTRSHNGKVIAYMDDADFVLRDAQLNNHFLQSLQSGAKLVIIGTVKMTEKINAELFREKIDRVEFLGEVYIREEYLEVLNSKLHNSHQCALKVIPTGAQFFEGDLVLDEFSVLRFEEADMYISGDLRITDDVSVENVEKSIRRLHVSGQIICRKALKLTVYQRSDDVNVSFLDYSGKLFVIEGEYKLTKSELIYTQEKLGLVVSGILNLSSNIDPELLAGKVESVVNTGIIKGTEEQCGVIRTKLRSNTGLVEDSHDGLNKDVAENFHYDPDTEYIENMNMLTL
ncbi:hypothetical protein [Ferroacidibacillus organovorans]|uniref:Uncharacterized protein n=1 Tax=Ferroacidibacillus organovorans TaxID=1765683 RepID=A0A1V4ERB2_9BACL|nr:hypothetical protein [Ferroacidibacillus organovorans]OPG15473.1 hypothetical protein B2M26_10310 [Ferroacidibacillus organovorans]